VNSIFEELGSILKISPVYQTPAMGFEGDDFLNCVILVESNYLAEKTLKTILSIEKKLGRTRSEKEGYTSRPIDIDILFYNDELIETKNLIVPHPRLQNRKFVLQPLTDISPDFQHKTINTK
jgi:2-amino-4-hydroxy-6-hydroxymethyldihydropteridine diphosphokinase